MAAATVPGATEWEACKWPLWDRPVCPANFVGLLSEARHTDLGSPTFGELPLERERERERERGK